jgi:hypothetical protein
MRRIIVTNAMDRQLAYSALENYFDKLEKDKRTKYDGDEHYGVEDELFLRDAADRTRLMLEELLASDDRIVRKM